MKSPLAPAAQIIAGLNSESLLDRMCAALRDVDVMDRAARFDAYQRAGIDINQHSIDDISGADNGAKVAELSRRIGRTS